MVRSSYPARQRWLLRNKWDNRIFHFNQPVGKEQAIRIG